MYSEAKFWLIQGHPDHIRTIDLTFADCEKRIAKDNSSVEDYGTEKDKATYWQFCTGDNNLSTGDTIFYSKCNSPMREET